MFLIIIKLQKNSQYAYITHINSKPDFIITTVYCKLVILNAFYKTIIFIVITTKDDGKIKTHLKPVILIYIY